MLSRTADNLYWLARYVERAEYLARILEVSQLGAGVGTRLRHLLRLGDGNAQHGSGAGVRAAQA
jgi:uncharacterized alpha-E superfamily protein